MSKRIKHNDLLPWFTMNHADLPPAYLASCREFFKSIRARAPSNEPQASSSKQVTTAPEYDIIKTEREKYENK